MSIWENIRQTQNEQYSTKLLANILQKEIMKCKELLKNCPRLEETKEMLQLKTVYDRHVILDQKKDISKGKLSKLK